MADARDAELRERVRAILAANRELGARYEDAAVDQIVDLLQGRPPRRVQPAAPPPPPPARSAGWSPLAIVAAIAAVALIGLPLLRVAVGMLAGMIDAFAWVVFAFACIYLIKLFQRMTRGRRRPRAGGDAWEDARGHRWRRVD